MKDINRQSKIESINLPEFLLLGGTIYNLSSISEELRNCFNTDIELVRRREERMGREIVRTLVSRVYNPANIEPFLNGERDYRIELLQGLAEEDLERYNQEDDERNLIFYEDLRTTSDLSNHSDLNSLTGRVDTVPLIRVLNEDVFNSNDSYFVGDVRDIYGDYLSPIIRRFIGYRNRELPEALRCGFNWRNIFGEEIPFD